MNCQELVDANVQTLVVFWLYDTFALCAVPLF